MSEARRERLMDI
jgi:hypothetical protein